MRRYEVGDVIMVPVYVLHPAPPVTFEDAFGPLRPVPQPEVSPGFDPCGVVFVTGDRLVVRSLLTHRLLVLPPGGIS